ncbi:BTAF1-like protein [Mya arenaria]|uniref:BTAF1-like protein n=1 Tax=Mya arenaria TaxID=6604 RepID=A0ABY7DCA3_MYAAR|nr:BTAF1-like protein [Mya arenaria]
MGTDQLLDLFTLEEKRKGESASASEQKHSDKQDTVKAILDGLGDLWDEQQYESEYDINTFMKSLINL